MPFPNQHAARQKSPGDFKKDSFRTASLNFPKGITAIIGVPKGSNKTEIQSIRFDKKLWSPAEARKWLKDNNFKTTLEEAVSKSFWGSLL